MKETVTRLLRKVESQWLKLGNPRSQAFLALACNRMGEEKTAHAILASLRERAVRDEELGMYLPEVTRSSFCEMPVSTQTLLIEAFDEIAGDSVAVEECKIWILNRKRTSHWENAAATVDAVYALLLRGRDLSMDTSSVRVRIGAVTVTDNKREAGSGYFEKRFPADSIRPSFANITVLKESEGVAWGGVHYQYIEELSHIDGDTNNLQIEAEHYLVRDTKSGEQLQSIRKPLHIGDKLAVRLVLRTDRDMEFVHIGSMRAGGLEPVFVPSGYQYQDGISYYRTTRDAADHFYIDHLPKGTYVFESRSTVERRGRFQSGMAQIECLYAPEFGSHSGGRWIEVR